MKKNILLKIYLAAFLCLPFVISSCSDDDNDTETKIELSSSEIKINKIGLADDGLLPVIDITSNKYWKAVVEGADWLKLDISGGEGVTELGGYGETEITLLAGVNDTDQPRTATVKLTTIDDQVVTFEVKQDGSTEEIFYFRENIDGDLVTGKLPVSAYAAWTREGLSSAGLRFIGEGIYVTNDNPSKGYEGASGNNNIFFAKWEDNPNAELALTSTAIPTRRMKSFTLSFATATKAASFNKKNFKVSISKDNLLWSDLEYTRSDKPGWEKSEIKLYFDDPHSYIYFRFSTKDQNTFSVDDILLLENAEGEGLYQDMIGTVEDNLPLGHVYFEDDFKWSEKEKKEGVNWSKDGLAMPYAIPMVTDNREEIRLDYDNSSKRPYQYFDGLYEAKLAAGWTSAATAVRVYVSYGALKSGTASAGKNKADGILISPKMTGIPRGAYIHMKATIKASIYKNANKSPATDKISHFTVTIPDDIPGTIDDGITKSKTFTLTKWPPETDEITFTVYSASADTYFMLRSPDCGEDETGVIVNAQSKEPRRLYYRYFKFEKTSKEEAKKNK